MKTLILCTSLLIAMPVQAAEHMDKMLEHVDCSGHKGRSTICVANNTSSTLVGLRCGSYEVPITTYTHVIQPYLLVAVVDLGDSPRTCRKEGLTATTQGGKVFKATLDGADVSSSTIASFTE